MLFNNINYTFNENLLGDNSILVDSLYSNLAYLEPRYVLNAKKLVDTCINEYFVQNKNLPLLDSFKSSTIDEMVGNFKKYQNIVNAKKNLIDAYYIMFNEVEEGEIEKWAFFDIDNYVKKEFAKGLLEIAERNNSIDIGLTNNITKIIRNIPKSKIEETYLNEDKIKSYVLMDKLLEVSTGIEIKDKKKLSVISESGSNLICKQENGWFDIGYEKNKRGECECSFYAGYIEGEFPKTLHIAFRGTEKNAASMSSYFLKDYPNMMRHYKRIEPFLREIIKQEVENNDTSLNIAFSGHSLGAAMTELALYSYKNYVINDKSVNFSGVGIANPGGIHVLHDKVSMLDKNNAKIDRDRIKDIEIQSNLINALTYPGYMCNKINNFTQRSLAFLRVGAVTCSLNCLKFLNKKRSDENLGVISSGIKKLYKGTFKNKVAQIIGISFCMEIIENVSKSVAIKTEPVITEALENIRDVLLGKAHEDERMITINHIQDPVCKIGGTVANYKKNNRIIIEAINPIFEKMTEVAKVIGFVYHDNNNYISEIENMVANKVAVSENVAKVLKTMRSGKLHSFKVSPT